MAQGAAARELEAAASPRTVLLVMCAGSFLVLLDVTIVNVALPAIGAGLDAGVSGLQWVVDGYAIALAGLMLGAGTAGDVHGHKRVVLCGLALFGLASLGCALAPGITVFVAGRVLQGAGAAMLLPGTLAVVAHVFPDPAARAAAIGLWAGIGSAALSAGPLLGGALVELAGWRAVFYVNLPVVAVAFAAAVRVVPETPGAPGRRIDLPGVLLGAALLGVVTFALIDAGRGGAAARPAAALGLAVVLLAAFLVVERRAADPMLPPALFRRPAFTTANAVAGTMNLCTLGLLFVLTLYLQRVLGRSALGAPAVVAAAIDAVPTDRAGLASAVNNTARQAGGAIGIAAFGALAGPPGARGFVGGFHTAAIVAAALHVAAAVGSLALVPARASG